MHDRYLGGSTLARVSKFLRIVCGSLDAFPLISIQGMKRHIGITIFAVQE